MIRTYCSLLISYLNYGNGLTKNVYCLALLLLFGWSEARRPEYGLATVDEFCQGYGELDQLGDVASQMMSKKFPKLGSTRVSKFETID